jgi:hypothetical protein
MRTSFFKFCSSVALACMAHSALPVATQARQQPAAPFSTREGCLRRFLQGYVSERGAADDETTLYSYAFVDLNGDGKDEAIVHLTGSWWCGTGGCTTLILAAQGSSYKVVTRITITRPPIRVLKDASNGWRSIAVWVVGGSSEPGYEAELRFDGTTYPSNPSVPPARRLTGRAAGETVLSSSQVGVPLHP